MKAKMFDTLRSKVSDLVKEDPIIDARKDKSASEDKDAALNTLFQMNETFTEREVFKDAGSDRPYTQEEIEAFLELGNEEE